jgi:WD40 repeat protein
VFVITGRRRGVDRLVFAPDGSRLAWASRTGPACVYDFTAGVTPRELPVRADPPATLAFRPDGRRLVAWDAATDLLTGLDAATGVVAWTVAFAGGEVATAVAADADGEAFWAGVVGDECGVRRYNFADGRRLGGEPAWPAGVTPKFLAATAGGRYLAAVGRDGLYLCERAGRVVRRPTVVRPLGLSASADGRTTAIIGREQLEVVALPGLERLTLLGAHDPRAGVGGVVAACALTPDASHVLAVNNGPSVAMTAVATGRVVRTWAWPVGKLRGVAVAPDGRRAAAGSGTGQVVVWDIDP